MNIYVNNRQPVPAIYNVKQFSANAYTFVFFVPKDELNINDFSSAEAVIKTSAFTTALEIVDGEDYIILVWVPSSAETAAAGTFDIQLQITEGNYVWQSYAASYCVSGSVPSGQNWSYVYTGEDGKEYGLVAKSDGMYLRFAGVDTLMRPLKVYESQEDADADTTYPDGGIGLIL